MRNNGNGTIPAGPTQKGVIQMTQEAKNIRAAYMRAWRKKNPEKVKEYEIRHWERKAAEERRKQGADCLEAPQTAAEEAG